MGAPRCMEENERILTEREYIKFGISRARTDVFEISWNDVNRGAWKPAPKTNKKK